MSTEHTDLVWHVYERTIPAALALLPGRMTSDEAVAELLAIGLQESRFKYRRQVGPGPARGFWQFERGGGITEVLENPMTKPLIVPICELLLYEPTPTVCHLAVENNDVLAACFARLLLYRDPATLPTFSEEQKGWDIYLRNWRPGKPHPQTWPQYYRQAWSIVKGTS